jgi:hypothetical protein
MGINGTLTTLVVCVFSKSLAVTGGPSVAWCCGGAFYEREIYENLALVCGRRAA